jgi:hypothetical protein
MRGLSVEADDQPVYVRQQLIDAWSALAQKAVASLELDTEDDRVATALMELCVGMFNAGIRAGSAHAVVQLAQQPDGFKASTDTPRLPGAGELP